MEGRRRIGWAAWLLVAASLAAATSPAPTLGVGEATVESIEIAILESFPVRVHAVLRGSVPDACTEIDTIEPQRDGNRLLSAVRTRRPVDEVCAQVITPFEATVELAVLRLPAGPYTAAAGEAVAGFELAADRVLQRDA